jgi:AcrR family transcriptional regulator
MGAAKRPRLGAEGSEAGTAWRPGRVVRGRPAGARGGFGPEGSIRVVLGPYMGPKTTRTSEGQGFGPERQPRPRPADDPQQWRRQRPLPPFAAKPTPPAAPTPSALLTLNTRAAPNATPHRQRRPSRAGPAAIHAVHPRRQRVHTAVNAVDTPPPHPIPSPHMARPNASVPASAAPPAAPPAARPRLDRERILDAAQAIADAHGVAAVTMRRIGAQLDVDPTAVYRHFRSKDELLHELADRLFGTLPDLDPSLTWRDTVKAELRHALDRYRQHPDLALLLAVQPDDTPSLQAIADRMLGHLLDRGLTAADAARYAQVIENHVVGTGLYYAVNGNTLRDVAAQRRAYALLPADTHPHAVAAAAHLFPDLDASFDLAGEAILDAIEALADTNTTINPGDR